MLVGLNDVWGGRCCLGYTMCGEADVGWADVGWVKVKVVEPLVLRYAECT